MSYFVRRALAPLLLALFVCSTAAAQSKPVAPSENKGKVGTYTVQTSKPEYLYNVYVPRSYSDSNPAGIHLFFHGQGSQGAAKDFSFWKKHFCDPHNVIAINMQYTDGDNMKDTGGKVAAAIEAIRQISVDYKIIPGRGAVSSFSGGGLPHGMLFQRYGQAGNRGEWPFCQMSLYSSNFSAPVRGGAPMSWLIAVGGKEWNLAGLGPTLSARAWELFSSTGNGGSPDVYFRVDADKRHSIADEDVAGAAAAFARADLAQCGFIYAADYPEKDLKQIVTTMNQLALGRAAKAIDALLARKELNPDLQTKATALNTALDARVQAVVDMTRKLAAEDPVLLAWYGPIFSNQLKDHPRLPELRELISTSQKEKASRAAVDAYGTFLEKFRAFFRGDSLAPGARDALKKLGESAPPESLLGRMCGEYQKLPG